MGDRRLSVLATDRFRAKLDIRVIGSTRHRAPFTGSFECTIPAGTLLVVDVDPVRGATGFSCVPEDYEGMLTRLVPEEDRNRADFWTYYLNFDLKDIGVKLERV